MNQFMVSLSRVWQQDEKAQKYEEKEVMVERENYPVLFETSRNQKTSIIGM